MREAHFSHHDSYLAGRSGAREGVWRRRREGDLLRDNIDPVRGGAVRERGYGEEGVKGIFCATTSIPCGEERRAGGGMEKKARSAFFSIPPPLGERRRRER